jgi:hypothetical protein
MKKVFFILIAIRVGILPALAQLDLGSSLVSSSDRLIMNALEPSVVILRQDYGFKRENDTRLYGSPGKRYFSRVYQVGFMGEGKVMADSGFFNSPWLQDTLYFSKKKQSEAEKFFPAKADLALRFWGKREFGKADSLGLKKWRVKGAFASCGINDTLSGFPVSPQEIREGWLLVVHASDKLIEGKDNASLSFSLLKLVKDELATTDNGVTKKNPLNQFKKPNVVGGIFFVAEASLGKLQFSPAGLLVSRGGKWQLQLAKAKAVEGNDFKLAPTDELIKKLEVVLPDSTGGKTDKGDKKGKKEPPAQKPKKRNRPED